MVYKTKGVCAQGIEFEIDDNKKVHNIKFTGGCSGNTQGVAHLAEGMDADEVISRLEGILWIQAYFMSGSAGKSYPSGTERRLICQSEILLNHHPAKIFRRVIFFCQISVLSHLSHSD